MTGLHAPISRTAGEDRPHSRPSDARSSDRRLGRSPLGGADPLARTLGRLLRPLRQAAPEAQPPGALAADAAVQALALRLDERGCASGRVTAARLDEVSRAFDRLEAKLNAILVAVTATFVSTLLGLLAYALRARPGVLGT